MQAFSQSYSPRECQRPDVRRSALKPALLPAAEDSVCDYKALRRYSCYQIRTLYQALMVDFKNVLDESLCGDAVVAALREIDSEGVAESWISVCIKGKVSMRCISQSKREWGRQEILHENVINANVGKTACLFPRKDPEQMMNEQAVRSKQGEACDETNKLREASVLALGDAARLGRSARGEGTARGEGIASLRGRPQA